MRDIERIVDVSYRAPDGSRHASREAAVEHARAAEREATRTRVIDVLRRPLSDGERGSMPAPHPLSDWRDAHHLVEASVHASDVGELYERLADLLMQRMDEVVAAMRPTAVGEDDDPGPVSWGGP